MLTTSIGVSARDTLQILQAQNPGTLLQARDVYNARAALTRDPSVVDPSVPVNLPQIYRRPALTPEEKVRAECRLEVSKAKEELEQSKEEWRKEVDGLREKLREKEKLIEKFEMFIDICNQRVMVQRERLGDESVDGGRPGAVSGS